MTSLAPSILSADFGRLNEELAAVERSGLADRIHVDVMDGQFVPPISFGPVICAAARRATNLPLDVHLMVVQPARFYEELKAAGASGLTVHVEACPHLHRDLGAIKALGMRAGVTLNPGTPVEALTAVLEVVDLVLVMSVNPGWGGQPFITASADRVRRVAALLAAIGRRDQVEIEVDGGINATTAQKVVAAGADVLVAGSAAFGHKDGVAAGLAALGAALRPAP
jgi:ribulose-phosphate 3-epimerase